MRSKGTHGKARAPLPRRALRPDDKDARREAIVDAAADVFARADYDDITMSMLAARVELAKGTLYLYFTSKESLFLAILERKFDAWFIDLEAILKQSSRRPVADRVADALAESLTREPLLPRLLSLLHHVLERNLQVEEGLAFKRSLLVRLQTLASMLAQYGFVVDKSRWLETLLTVHALIVGLWQTAHPPPALARAMRNSELEGFLLDFRSTFRDACLKLIV